MTDFTAYLRLGVDSRDAVTAQKDLNKMAAAGEKAESSFVSLKGVAGLLGTALGALGAGRVAGDLIEITRQTGIMEASLRTATGSVEGAETAFRAISRLATELPESIDSVSTAFTKLVNYGLDPSEAAIRSYSNTAAALGKDLMQMVEAVADAATGEFERLKEFGIKSKVEGDNVSFTFRGVTKTIKNSAEEIEQYLQNIGNVDFAGAATERMKTLDGAISNLGDSYDSLLRTVSDAGIGDLITSGVRAASDAIQEFDAIIASGQAGAYFDAFIGKFSTFTDAARTAFTVVAGYYDDFIAIFGEDINGAADFIVSAFKNLPENVAAFIQIAAVEIAVLVDKAKVYGEQISFYLDPSNWFGDGAPDISGALAAIESSRAQSISLILEERDAALSSYDQQINAAERLRQQFDESNEAIIAGGDVLGQFAIKADAAADSTGKISKQAKEMLAILEKQEIDELFSFAEDPFDMVEVKSKKAKNSVQSFSDDAIERLGNVATQGFKGILDGAENAFDAVGDLFKQLLAEMAYEGAKPIFLNLQQSLGGGNKAGEQAGQAGSAVSAGGIYAAIAVAVVAGVGVYNKEQEEQFAKMTAEFRQGNQSIGTILGQANAKSDSINNSITELSKYADDSLGVNRGMLQALLDIRSGIAGVAAGFARTITGLGNTNIRTGTGTMIDPRLVSGEAGIAEIYSRREDFSLLAKAGLNDPITDFVSNFLGALGNKVTSELFKKSTKIIDSGIVIPAGQLLSDIMANGTIEAFAYADVQTKKKVLGLTTSNKVKTQTEALNDVLLGQFADVFSSAGSALEQAADVFGLDFDKYINRLIIDPQKLSLKDLEGDALTKEIENFFSSTLDNWAGVLVGGTEILNQFQQVGEGAFETVIRLAGELNVFNSYADALNLNFTASGFAAVTASQNIAELAGGFDKLNSSLSGYYQNFFTEEERAERQMSLLATELSKLGVDSVPASREAFRSLIEGIDLTTEAGQKQFAGLINLQAVFAELVPATKDAADAVDSAADAMSRLKSAAQDSFSVLENLVNAERDRIEAIVSGATSAKSALDAALSAERDSITSAHNERLSQLETLAAAERDEAQRRANAQNEANKALARARIESINDERSAVEDRIGGLRSLFDELSGTVDDLAIQSADLSRTRRRQAEFEVDTALANARAGRGLPVDGKLSEALAVLRDNPASLYRTAEEMAYATAVLQNKIGDLAGLTEDQLSYEEKSISSLDKQLAAAESAADSLAKVYAVTTTSYDALIAQEKEQYTASLASLDIIAKNAQDQYDLLTGINTKTLSVEDALNKFNESLLAADFDNAQEQYKRLDDMLDAGRSQLDELININNGIKDIPAAIEALAKQLEALREEQRIQALTQQKTLNETARNTRILATNEEVPV